MNSQEELVSYLKEIGVLKSPHLAEAFLKIDRKDFVREDYKNLAYDDHPLPIGEGQTISQPYTVAFMMELLNPQPGEKILDIGAGSGWTSAILASVGEKNNGKIFAMEKIPELCDFSKKNISKYNFIEKGIIEYFCRSAENGLFERAPFDKILCSASLEKEIPESWKNQLKAGGIIVSAIKNSIWRYVKNKDGSFEKKEFPGFVFVPFVKRSGKEFRWKNFLAVFSGLVFICSLAFYYLVFVPPANPFQNKIFIVEKNQTAKEISRNLAKERITRSSFVFKTLVWLKGKEKQIRAGKYIFEKPSSALKTLDIILAGPIVETKKITIPEGANLKQIGEILEKENFFSKEEWLAFAKNPNLEGYLFPDTYFFDKSATPAEVAQTMVENLESKITEEMKKEMEKNGFSFYEILTLASLIEKESFDSLEERKMISGIIQKRLKSKMPLQIDATIAYLTGKPSSKIAEEDLKIDSFYNTYKYKGLPSGPIANPGLDSITAAIYPKNSPFWYYLHAKNGKIYYAKNFEEHKLNKARYLYE